VRLWNRLPIIDTLNNIHVDDNVIDASLFGHTGIGVQLLGNADSNHIHIRNFSIDRNDITISDSSSKAPPAFTGGIEIIADAGASYLGGSVSKNKVYARKTTGTSITMGISVTGVDGLAIHGNTFTFCKDYMIELISSTASVVGNVGYGSGVISLTMNNNHLIRHLQSMDISHNIFDNPAPNKFCIRISPDVGDIRNLKVSNNIITNPSNTAIIFANDVANYAIRGLILSHNQIYSTYKNGIDFQRGVKLFDAQIEDNIIVGNGAMYGMYGIFFDSASGDSLDNVSIADNIIRGFTDAIHADSAKPSNWMISGNIISSTTNAINLANGGNFLSIHNNYLYLNGRGIYLRGDPTNVSLHLNKIRNSSAADIDLSGGTTLSNAFFQTNVVIGNSLTVGSTKSPNRTLTLDGVGSSAIGFNIGGVEKAVIYHENTGGLIWNAAMIAPLLSDSTAALTMPIGTIYKGRDANGATVLRIKQ
jgi:hypothetical protein